MTEILTKAIIDHENDVCDCDFEEGGKCLCLAGQFINNIITEEEFNLEIGE
jgi:hypothetical protein